MWRQRSVLLLKILRGRYDGFMPRVLRKVRDLFPGARLVFVAPSRALRWLPFPEPDVDEVLTLEAQGFAKFKEAVLLLRRLKRMGLKDVVIVYDGHCPFGYLKMEAFALLTGRPRVLSFVREEGPRERSRWWLLGRVLMGLIYLGASITLAAIYCLLTVVLILLFDFISTPLVLALRGKRR